MDAEIYPIFKQEFQKSSLLQVGLEERRLKLVRARVLPERIQALSNQIEEFLGGLDSSSSDKQSDGQKLHQELGHSHTQVQMKLEEYETVLNLFSKLLGHISQIETMCTSYQESTRKQGTPRHVQAAKAALQELNDWKLNLESEEKSANKYLEAVFKEVRTLKTNQQFQPDLELLAKLQSQLILAAETLYAEYKTLFTDNLGFCEYTAVQRELCLEIDQLIRLVKTKLLVTENISSVGALDTVLNPLLERISITESKVQEITRKGETLLLTNHGSAVELGQSQLQDKWAGLEALLSEQKQKLASAVLYFSHIEKAENFIKQSTTRILHWSNEVTGQKCIERCSELVKEIEMYIKREKQVQDDNITKMTALAGKIYGNDAILRIKSLHMETNEAFTGIQALRQKFLGLEESLKREKKEEERVRKLKAETDKRIAAAEEAAKTAKIEAEAAAAEKRAVQHLKEKEAAVRRAAAEAEKAAKLKEMNELEQLRRKEKELEIREIKLRNEEELRKKEEEVRIRIEKEELKRKQREEAPPRPPSPVGDPPPEHVPPVFLHLLQDKVELAGTRCILSAKVSGVPLPIVTWFK
ncbi:reticulocyte-binding protein 2 homolog a, partial [Eurytemora carolleeae]|uniref:reticulocyte-binding protein 2 homolog a n=1 Tax=Eurytemora carolleeae TaxID=1294199 RepID=UPI000C7955C8